MGKLCLMAIPVSSVRRLISSSILVLSLAGLPAQAASNQARAALHIQVVVVPTVQTTEAQPSATTTTGSISYNLQPSTAPKMSSQVTVQPISQSGRMGSGTTGQSRTGAVLKTTTIFPE